MPPRVEESLGDDDSNHTQGRHGSPGGRAARAVLRRAGVLPDAHQRAARGEPFLAGADIHRPGHREVGAVRSELCHQDAAPQHSDRFVCRQSQAAAGAAVLEHAEQRPLREGSRGIRIEGRRHRLRDVHAPARRPRGLEHAAGERTLGANLSQGEICHGRPRARILDAEGEGGSLRRSLDYRLGAADRGGQTRAGREERLCAQCDPVHSDARPYHRPLLRAGRPARARRVDHRRYDSFADPGKISRARHARGLRFAAGRTNAASGVRSLLRFVHAHVRGALSVALDRPRAALGRRLQIRRVSGRIRVEKPGLIVAPLTPFTADLEGDAVALRREIDYVLSDCRATMVVAAGVETQEYTYLSLEQRKALIRHTIECVDRRVPVMVGISHPSFKTAIELAHFAESLGAAAVQLLAPLRPFAGPPTQADLIAYFSAVARETSLPITLYLNPGPGAEVSIADTIALAKLPRVQLIKES